MVEIQDDAGPERARLLELAQASRASLASLSAMLGRNPSYLQQFVRKGSPRRLEERDRQRLAEFFGVPETELGAPGRGFPRGSAEEFLAVPRLPLDASAGPGAVGSEEISLDSFRFSRRWLREMGL
ncbi:MAG: transcriptional regulator, partial [Alphaproteobacteria bacterium]|nr:transcriptional regulator [Alphaproteobacteria bacterium]